MVQLHGEVFRIAASYRSGLIDHPETLPIADLGVRQNLGEPVWRSYNKDCSIFGVYTGSPYLGKLPDVRSYGTAS